VRIALGTEDIAVCGACDPNQDGAVSIDEVVAAVASALHGCPIEPIFPADYRDTYREVRDCRLSVEHDFNYVRVLASPDAAQPYIDLANPLPVGSIIVKEEFSQADCSGDLVRYRAMRKEMPDYDRDGDWHWQEVSPDRVVKVDGKQTCIGCHQRPACLARDYMCTEGGPPQGRLQFVLKDLPPALLSITGTSPTDVYTVGADPKDGFGPYVLHYDGVSWHRLNTGTTGSNLWWISLTPIDGAYYMAGENGLILRYDVSAGKFEKQTTPGTALLYGIWGAAANDIWAVGGDPAEPDTGGVIWHYDGMAWTALDVTTLNPNGLPILFKVWGRSASEVYAVGRLGVILRFDGMNWAPVTSNFSFDLFTVHGNDTITAAVGSSEGGAVLELQGDEFVDVTPANAQQLNGIFIPPNGNGVAVGIAGSAALRSDMGWKLADTGLVTTRDFHATWVDPEGAIWAVGGNLNDFINGVLAYGGTRTIGSEIIDIDPCPPGVAGGPTTVSYSQQIRPLFQAAGCTSIVCHGGAFPNSNYDMRSYETLFGPGAAAKSFGLCEIVPGNPDPDTSFLINKLLPNPRFGQQMPSGGPPLTDDQMALLRTWIMEGAQDDSPPTPTRTPTRPTTPSPTATRTRTRTRGASLTAPSTTTPMPTMNTTPAAVCSEVGVICTMAGTGRSLFDGDGKPALDTSFYWPIGVNFDRNSRPLILDWNNLRLRRINADGRVQTIMGDGNEAAPEDGALASQTPLHHSSDVELDGQGRMYVAGYHVPYVFRVETDDRVTIIAGGGDVGNDGDGGPAREASMTSPYAVQPTSDGGVYVSDIGAHVIRVVDATGKISTVAGAAGSANIQSGYKGDNGLGTAALLNAPAGMTLDANGELYFCDSDNHVIRHIDGNGIITTFAGTGASGYDGDNEPARQATFTAPSDLLFAPNGDLYVADTGNNVIRRIDRNQIVTTVIGTGTSGFTGDQGSGRDATLKKPLGVRLSPDGSLWIADTLNNRVRRVFGFLSSVE